MSARTLMVQGTASSVGKSLLVAGLCRVLRDEGLRVAPFKAQNIALNSAVTADGLEIGRAQAVQARAAGIEPTVHMNPILLKPEAGMRAQLVLRGRARGTLSFSEPSPRRAELVSAITESLDALVSQYEVVLIEGAGSPAEINLKDRDLSNGFVAQLADAPVLLVGDIDRGGVFASLYGTLALLDESERARVRGLLINKFRGDRERFRSALPMFEEKVGRPVLGVVPFIEGLRLPDEDSTELEPGRTREAEPRQLEVAVLALPHLSNYDDVLPLQRHPALRVRFVDRPRDVLRADLLVIPGSKSTVHDLHWLRERGLGRAILARAEMKMPVLGICAGFQMLGLRIEDPLRVESNEVRTEGLGLLPVYTEFERSKRTERVTARARAQSLISTEQQTVSGYLMHMGRVRRVSGSSLLETTDRGALDECAAFQSADGNVVGTLVHGLFEDSARVEALLEQLRLRTTLVRREGAGSADGEEAAYEQLATTLREAIDTRRLFEIVGL